MIVGNFLYIYIYILKYLNLTPNFNLTYYLPPPPRLTQSVTMCDTSSVSLCNISKSSIILYCAVMYCSMKCLQISNICSVF